MLWEQMKSSKKVHPSFGFRCSWSASLNFPVRTLIPSASEMLVLFDSGTFEGQVGLVRGCGQALLGSVAGDGADCLFSADVSVCVLTHARDKTSGPEMLTLPPLSQEPFCPLPLSWEEKGSDEIMVT